jgi:AcrR family transcriptional regulator
VVAAGLAVVARRGLSMLTARQVADEMGASTAPVYSNFANMDELADAVKRAAVAKLLASTREEHTTDRFLDMSVGVLRFVWDQPAVYASLFLEQSGGYDPGPDFMGALVETMAELPELDPLPMTERIIVLKKLALFTHGVATEICQGCAEHCTFETVTALLREVGDAIIDHARAGVVRDPETARQLAAFWDPAAHGCAPGSADPEPQKEDVDP